jgi:hypothetical protein
MAGVGIPETPLLEGDFYEGAFGPSILLVLTSRESVTWLREVFGDLAVAPTERLFSLVSQPEVQIGAAVGDILLRRVSIPPEKHLAREDYDRFVWSCTSDEWETMSLLLEPFLERPGHQYLTNEGADDALIEVSFGERHG